MGSLCHESSTICAACAEAAFRYFADLESVGAWTLGSWGASVVEKGLARGTSLFDDSVIFIRADPEAHRLVVDIHVGHDSEDLAMRISVRIVPSPILRHDVGSCVLTILAWCPRGMDDERWARLCASHDVEIQLLRRRSRSMNDPFDFDGSGHGERARGRVAATCRRSRPAPAQLAPRARLLLADVAAGTGVSASFLSMVEKGRSDITISRLMRIVN